MRLQPFLALPALALGGDDCPDPGMAGREIVINQDIIIFRPVADLVASPRHAPGDNLVAVLGPAPETRLQGGDRRGQDEDGDHQRPEVGIAELLGTLPVDVEQHIAPGPDRRLDRAARGAVGVAEDNCVLEHLAAGHHRVKPLLGHE